MAQVTLDLVDGNRATLTRDGWRNVERTATVEGLTGNAHARLKAAVALLESEKDIKIGDEHDSLSGAYLEEIVPKSLSTDVAKLRLVYKQAEAGSTPGTEARVEVGATLVQKSTHRDINGILMEVEYTDAEGVTHKDGGTVSFLHPQKTASYYRVETFNPESLADHYVGKLNQFTWKGNAPGTVLCTAITGTSTDGEQTWPTTYSFQRDTVEHWQGRCVYFDSATGKPPSDPPIVAGKGEKYYDVQKTADFGALNL